VNRVIVKHGYNGLWARTQDEWFDALATLVRSAETRRNLGVNARSSVLSAYSRKSASTKLSELMSVVLPNHCFATSGSNTRADK
jgi:hypothetical protein